MPTPSCRSLFRNSTARALGTLALVAALQAKALSQNVYIGQEPNETKSQATPAIGAASGDIFQTSPSGASYFRIRTAPLPLGIHRYELSASTSFYVGSMSLRGRGATTDWVDPNSDLSLQSTSASTPIPGPYVAWYGFGKSEELFADISIAVWMRPSGGSATLTATPVVEHGLGALQAQPLELVARPLLGLHDLEVHVFGPEFDAIPYAALDDSAAGSPEVRLPFDAPPGVYHIAVTDREGASHLAPSAVDQVTSSSVLDFAGAFVCSSRVRPIQVELAIEPVGGGPPLALANATMTAPFEVLWFRLELGQGQSLATYCSGDGSVGACGCMGNSPSQSGMGCLNSSGRGATVIALDHLQQGQWRVTLEDLPAHTLALAFVGLQGSSPAQAFGGLSCIAPGAVRVGPVAADAAGTAVIPAFDPTAGGFLAGQTLYLQGAYRDALAPAGCMINFTSGFSFPAR